MTHDSTLAGQIDQRREQVTSLRAAGSDPYPEPDSSLRDQSYLLSQQVHSELPTIDDVSPKSESHVFTGRLIQLNNLGKLKFLFLRCAECVIQVCVSVKSAPEIADLLKMTSLGDHLSVTGHFAKTTRNSIVVLAKTMKIVSKALRPLPGKTFSVVVDDEWRANNRVADMMLRDQVIERLRARANAIHNIRQTLHSFNFIEAETSMLTQIAGGATAKPFATHHNALNKDMSLRIAPELDLKRLIIAGFDRVYELGRVFRNEGIDKTHNPEFTTLEIYAANSSMKTMISLMHALLRTSARGVAQAIPSMRDSVSRFETECHVVSMRSLIREICVESPISADEKPSAEELRELPSYASSMLGREVTDYGEALQSLFERFAEKTLLDPTIVTDHPASLSPLAKHDGTLAMRFELYIDGFEIANAYVEQADADLQRSIFVEQAKKNNATPDMRYCDDLELGLPPTVGLGIGIDRLMMVLMGAQSIKDVIAFPTR